jgi:nitroimidazol reductase NimA-like FMN-containing flavoprotein (pyridoxamine 5'-phosphate oxidase superfamily)/ribosomal protein S18 acetylase RimI-like enzyme
MRKPMYRMAEADALALLRDAPVVRLAAVGRGGAPILRTLHAALLSDGIYFHGAPAGEKVDAVGGPAVVAVDEIVATIPSYFVDPERACPATTYYRSAQLHGRLESVEDPTKKAAALAALMDKHQPQGGFVPLAAEHPLYRKAIAGLWVSRVRLERVDGKAKLGQNRRPDEITRILDGLWARGEATDPRAIETLRRAHPHAPRPAFLSAPPGVELTCAPGADDLDDAVALVGDEYWNRTMTPAEIRRAHVGSSAWVGARDESGRLVATARSISDGGKRAWIYDVAVTAARRGQRLGEAVMRLLLSHPENRGVRELWLATKDAQAFYGRLGFVERPARHPQMVLERTAVASALSPSPSSRATSFEVPPS